MGNLLRSVQTNTGVGKQIFQMLILVSLLFIVISRQSAQAAVTLVYFKVTAQNERVVLEWETATQIDTVGFYINRSFSQSSGFTRVGNFIVAQGDPLTGAIYSVTDSGLTNGVTYWYKLESIDTSQNSTFYDPALSVIPGTIASTSTPTRTPTIQSGGQSTVTSTATRTQTPISGASKTPTRTRTSTSQPATTFSSNTLAAASLTQQNGTMTPVAPTSVNITNTLGLGSSPTVTLIPLPQITLEFPTFTSTNTPTNTPVPSFRDSIALFPYGKVLLIGVVFVIWIILGGWFFHTLRRME